MVQKLKKDNGGIQILLFSDDIIVSFKWLASVLPSQYVCFGGLSHDFP